MKFKISASCGDIIYALPFIKSLTNSAEIHIGTWNYENGYIKVDTYKSLKRLLLTQPFIKDVKNFKSLKPKGEFDYDLDVVFKQQTKDGYMYRNHYIPVSFFKWYKKPLKIPHKWLKIGKTKDLGYYIVNETNKYQDHNVDLIKVIKELPKPCYFVGLDSEYEKYRQVGISRIECEDMLDVAYAVSGSLGVYCNQSAVLTIAQSLDKPVWLAKDKNYSNTLKGNDNILEGNIAAQWM